MARPGVRIRAAVPEDLPALVRLQQSAGGEPAGRRSAKVPVAELTERLAAVLTNPGRRVLVAVGDDATVAGAVVLGVDWVGDLLDVPAVHVAHLVVDQRCRRRGVGRSLIAAAAGYADEMGIEHVTTGVALTARDSNRFLARLGFAPLAVRRLAPVAVLRRRLAEPPALAVPATARARGRRRPVRLLLGAPGLGRAR